MNYKKYIVLWSVPGDAILSQNFCGSNEINVEATSKREAIDLAKGKYERSLSNPHLNRLPIKSVKFTILRVI